MKCCPISNGVHGTKQSQGIIAERRVIAQACSGDIAPWYATLGKKDFRRFLVPEGLTFLLHFVVLLWFRRGS